MVFYLRRQLAAGQVMGRVVVVVLVLVVLVFKTYLNIPRWSWQRRQGIWKGSLEAKQLGEGSNPGESFKREIST